jgi:site-specific recombinase XerD
MYFLAYDNEYYPMVKKSGQFSFRSLYDAEHRADSDKFLLPFDPFLVQDRPDNLDLFAWINYYLKKEVHSVESEHTERGKMYDLHKLLEFFNLKLPSKDIAAWDRAFTKRFIAAIEKEYDIAHEYRIFATTTNFINFLIVHKAIEARDNPTSGVKLRRRPQTSFQGVEVLCDDPSFSPQFSSKEKYALILDAALLDTHPSNRKGKGSARTLPFRNVSILAMLDRTGLRADELCGLTLAQREPQGDGLMFNKVKGKGNQERNVYVRSDAAHFLQQYLDTERHAIEQHLKKNGEAISPFVFCSYTGKRLHQANIYDIVKRLERLTNELLPKRGYEGVRFNFHPHSLRHERGIRLKEQGVPDSTIAERLGHKDLSHIPRYTQKDPNQSAEEIEAQD